MDRSSFVRTGIFIFNAAVLLLGVSTAIHAEEGWWIYSAGRGEPLCKKLLGRLAYYEPKGRQGCGQDVLLSYPEFTEPPWEELDPKQHEALIFELIKYNYEGGPHNYFRTLPDVRARNPDWIYRKKTKDFLQEQGRLRMWRTRLLSSYDDGRHPAPPGEQTIVQMGTIYTTQTLHCAVKPQTHWMGGVFFVTPDLRGPDPSVLNGTFAVLQASTVLIHEGKPVIINHEDIYSDNRTGFDTYCSFEFVKKEKK